MVNIVAGENLGLFSASSVGVDRGQAGIEKNGETISVNAVTGNLILQRSDELLVGRGQDAQVVRTYNSQGQYGDDNNDNFRFSFNQRIKSFVAGVYAIRVNGDGSEDTFTYDSNRGLYVCTNRAGVHDTLSSSGTTWTYVAGDTGLTETYDLGSLGKMTSQLDREGLGIASIGYDLLNRVSTLSDSSGQTLALQRDPFGNVSSLSTSSNGVTLNTVRYNYETYLDSSGIAQTRLHSVVLDLTPADGSIGDGNVFTTTYTYVDIPNTLLSTNLVKSIAQSDGNVTSFEYDGVANYNKVTKVTVGSGAAAQITQYEYLTGSTNVKQLLASGAYAITTINYDSNQRVTSVVTPPDANGQRLTTSYSYGADNNITKMVDARGNATYYQYDSHGNLTLEQNSQGDTTQYLYSANNLLLNTIHFTGRDATPGNTVTNSGIGNGINDATGALVTRYVYDSAQRLRFVVQADGSVQETRYSDSGSGAAATRMVTDITYLEDVYSLAALVGATTPLSESNMLNWLATLTDKSTSQVTVTQLDFRGQVVAVTTYAKTNTNGSGDTSTAATTYSVYDQHGNLLRSIDARGSSAADTAYDTVYAYDGMGRMLSVTSSTGPTTNQMVTTLYDDAHHKIVTQQANDVLRAPNGTSSNGLLTTRSYNSAGVLTLMQESAAPNGAALSTTTNVYDNTGLLRATIDPVGGTRYYFYDELGRRVGAIDGTGALTETIYDGDDNIVTTIGYANFVDATTIAALAAQASSGLFAASTATDALAGIRPAVDAQNDRVERKQYNVVGLLAHAIDAKGVTTDYIYDGVDRLLSTTSPSGLGVPRTTQYFYDAAGRQRGMLDADNYYTEYKYDQAGQLVETIRHADPLTSAQVSANNDSALSLSAAAPTLGSQVFAVPEGLPYVVGNRVRLATNGGSVYMEGLISSYSGSAMIVDVDTVMGSATSATWQVSATIYPRAEFSILQSSITGSKTFTTQVGLPYSVGTVVRLTAGNGADWMQGSVTAYSGDQMTVNITAGSGSGLHTSWDLTVANASNGNVIAPSLGSKTFGVPTGLNFNVNDRIRFSTNNGASYMEGLVTNYSGDRITVAIDTAVGSTTALTWQIGTAVLPSADFTLLPTIGNGSKTFTTQAGLPYAIGSVVRLSANSGAAWMQGAITAYSGDQMTVNMASTGGSGFYSHWDLGLANITSSSTAIPTTFPVTKTFTVPSGLNYAANTRVRFIAAGSSAWLEGVVQSYSVTSMSVTVDRASGSGSFSSWLLAGEITPSSSTSLSVGSGYKTFTVKAGLPYAGGNRVRFSTGNGATYMEGTVLSYSGTSMAVSVDTTAGSGTYSNWQLSSAGSALNAIAPAIGAQIFSVPANLAYSIGQRVRFIASGGTAWMEGVLQAYSGTSMTVVVDQISGSGSYANWQLSADVIPTSATSLSVGLGSKTFTTATGLPYVVGSRVRVSSNGGASYMEGAVTSYSGTSMIVAVDIAIGSGTYTNWQLSSERAAIDAVSPATGPRQFTVAAGLPYAVNTRVHFSADAGGAWMEGVITAYTGTQMTVAVDTTFGNTHNAYWALSAPIAAASGDIHTYTIYDRRGAAVASIDADGFVTATQYNNTGTVSSVTRFANSIVQARSPNAGQLAAQLAVVGGDASRLNLASILPSANSANDETISYTYNTLNQLATETDAQGVVTTYTYNTEGQLAATDITPAGNNQTTQRKDQRIYDIQGNLVEERFARYFDGGDSAAYQLAKDINGYDAAGRCISTTDAKGYTTYYIYDAEGQLIYSVDNTRALTAYTYNSFGEQQAVIAYSQLLPIAVALTASAIKQYLSAPAAGDRKTIYRYDTTGQLRYSVNALGYVVEQRYDAIGNLVEKIYYKNPVANPATTDFSALDATDAYDVHYVYDAANRLRFTIDSNNHITENRYDGLDQVTDTVEWYFSAPQTFTTFDIPSINALLSNATGQLATYTYDIRGEITATTQQSNVTVDANGVRSSTSTVSARYFVYDGFGRVQYSVDPLGFVTEHRFDAVGNAITDLTYQPALSPAEITAFQSNPVAVLNSPIAPHTVLTVVQRYYDAEGQLMVSIDPDGYATRNTRDNDGNIVQTTTYSMALWSSSVASGLDPLLRPGQTVIDAFVAQQTAGANNKIVNQFVYDALNQQQMAIDSDRYVTEYVRDARGSVIEEIHYAKALPATNTATTAMAIRNALAALESDNNVKIAAQQFVYIDAFGQQTYTLDASGIVRAAVYDVLGNVVHNKVYRTPFSSASWVTPADGSVAVRVRPSADDLKAFVDAQDALQSAANGALFHHEKTSIYNQLNEPLYFVDSDGYVTAYSYDAAGHVISEIKTQQALAIGAAIDASALATWIANSLANNSAVISSNYYRNGRLSIAIDGVGDVVQYQYDALGNTVQETKFSKAFTGTRTQTALETFAASGDHGDMIATHYVYNAGSQLRFEIDARGYVTENRYDAAGNAVQQLHYTGVYTATGATAYTLDALTLAYPVNSACANTQSFYDADGQVKLSIDAENYADAYAYDANGKVTAHYRTRAVLSSADLALSADALATKITTGQIATRAEYSVYDTVGQAIYNIDGEGYVTANSYDALGNRILSQRYGNKISFSMLAQVLTAAGLPQPSATPTEIQLQQWQLLLQNDRAATLATFVAAQTSNFTVIDRVAYDATHNSRVIVDGLGHVTREVYNDVGQIASRTAYGDALQVPAQNLADTSFDIVQFVASAIAADTAASTHAIVAHTTTFTYDPEGRLTSTTDALNNRIELTYDYAGNVVQRSEFDMQASAYATRTTHYTYDADSRLRYEIDPDNYVKETVYDGLGRVVQETQWANPLGGTASYSEGDVSNALGALHETSDAGIQHLDQSTRYTYDASGNMLTTTDALGRIETYAYDYAGRQTSKQIGASGPLWTFTYDKLGRLIDKVSPPVDVATVTVANVATTTATLTTHYVLDAFGNTTSEIQAYNTAAARTTTFIYDNLDRLITATQLGAGANGADVVRTQVYDANGNIVVTRDVDGHYTYQTYNAANQLCFEVNADDYATAYTYDAFGNVATLTRYANKIAAHAAGQVLALATMGSLVQPDTARDRSITYIYDVLNRETQRSQSAVYTVDGTDPTGTVGSLVSPTTVTMYNGFGEVLSTTQTTASNGVVAGPSLTMAYQYNGRGQKIVEINADNYEARWVYDAAGNTTSMTEYANAIVGAATDAVVSAQDRVTVNTYNAANLLVQEAKNNVATVYTYDALDNLHTLTDACQNTINYSYNSLGWLLSITEPTRLLASGGVSATPTTHYSYDAFGNQVQEVRHADTVGVPDQIIRSGFDALNHQVWTADANSHVVYSTYTNAGVLLHTSQAVTDAGVTKILNKYYALDNRGNQTSMSQSYASDTSAATYWIRYNAFGEVEARGAVVSSDVSAIADTSNAAAYETFTHDQAGRLLRTNANDGVVHLYGYDFAGRQVLDVTDKTVNNFAGIDSLVQLGNPAQWQNEVYSSREYDGAGHVLKEHGSAINDTAIIPTTTKIYDRWGNVVDQKGPRTEHTTYTYDFADRLLTTTRYLTANQPIFTTNAYDLLGNLVSTLDGNNNLTQKSYNAIGQLLSQSNAMSEAITYSYDGYGRVATETSLLGTRTNSYDVNGNLTHTVEGNENITYGYDQLARKTSSTATYYAGGNVETTTYFYNSSDTLYKSIAPDGTTTVSSFDAYGNKTNEAVTYVNTPAITQTWTFTSDIDQYFHRVSAHTEPGVSVSYSYGAGNRLSSEYYANGATKSYTYYSNGQQSSIVEGGVGTTSYAYDLSGNRISESYLNASNNSYYQSTTSTFDALNRVTAINDARADQPIQLTYSYDGVGNRIAVTDNTNSAAPMVQWYGYDAVNRVLIAKGSLSGNTVVCADTDRDAVSVTYDSQGRRYTSLSFQNDVWVSERYTYNSDGLLWQVYRAESATLAAMPATLSLYSQQSYDSKGRVITLEQYQAFTQKRSTTTTVFDDINFTETSTSTVTTEDSATQKVITTSITTTAKDATGKLLRTVRTDSGTTQNPPGAAATTDYSDTTTTVYAYRTDGKLSTVAATVVDNHTAANNIKGTDPNKYLDSDTSTYNYDNFGYLISVTHSDAKAAANVSYVNNAAGQVLVRNEAHGTERIYFFNDEQIGDHLSPAPPGATSYSASGSQPSVLFCASGARNSVTLLGGAPLSIIARNDIMAPVNSDAWKAIIHDQIVNQVTQAVVYLSTFSDKERQSVLSQLISTPITIPITLHVDHITDDGFYIDIDVTKDATFMKTVDETATDTLTVTPEVNESIEAFFMQTLVQKLEAKMQDMVNAHFAGDGSNLNGRIVYKSYVKDFNFSFNVPAPVVVDTGLNTDQFYSPTTPGANANTGSYTVQAGDTLQSIAMAMYGDSNLWFTLADANGLMGTEKLVAGQILRLPTVTATGNSTAAYKPYSPSDATGDVPPKLIFTPPAGSPQPADPCAMAAMIAIIILSVIVAVVVTVLTAGAASAAFGFILGAEVSATTTASVVTGAIAGAAGGFAGSLASQGVLIAFHQQDAIDWSQAGVDALIGGLTGGIGNAIKALGKVAQGVSKTLDYARAAASRLEEARPLLSGGLRQGLNLISGVSQGFLSEGLLMAMDPKREVDWAHVAAFGFAMGAGGAALGRGAGKLSGLTGKHPAETTSAVEHAQAAASPSRPHELDETTLNCDGVPRGVGESGACFVAGTLVHTRDGLKAIETIRVGDWVFSQPEGTGAVMHKRVLDTFEFDNKWVLNVTVANSSGKIELIQTTDRHPFYVVGKEWIAATELEEGFELVLANGEQARVAKVEPLGLVARVYNISVEDFHTYYVGELGVWAHNICAQDLNDAGIDTKKYGLTDIDAAAKHKKQEPEKYFDDLRNKDGDINDHLQRDLDEANGVARPFKRVSVRVAQKQEAEFKKLTGALESSSGGASDLHSKNDVTPHFLKPLDAGEDDRGYTTRPVRAAIDRQIDASMKTKVATAGLESHIPKPLVNLMRAAVESGKTWSKVSTRKASDGYQAGEDLTVTINQQTAKVDARAASDTPLPRSPKPSQVKGFVRHEQAHQAAHQFTHEPGSTVWAPTQGNQVVDTHMERFVAGGEAGSFIARVDTYHASSLYAARLNSDGTWDTLSAFYTRRGLDTALTKLAV